MFQELLQIFALHRRTVVTIGTVLGLVLVVVIFSFAKGKGTRDPGKGIAQELPAFHQFAEGTKAVQEGREDEALSLSYALKEELAKRREVSPAHAQLYLHTLYRIALLEMRAGSREKEILSWQILAKESEQTDFLENVREGDLSLKDWITYRAKQLHSS